MPELRIYCLGSFQASLDGIPLAFETDKARALLAYLAVEAPQAQPRQRLARLLWADQPPAKALHSLSQALSSLRKTLGEGKIAGSETSFLLVLPDSVQFNPASPFWLDVRQFQEDVAGGLRFLDNRPVAGRLDVRALQRAVKSYRGSFLEQLFLSGSGPYEEWALIRREGYTQQVGRALGSLAEYHERRGETSLARQAVERLAGLLPWDERVQGELLRLYALDGQWSAAQNQYNTFCRYLEREVGVEVSPDLARLADQIRRLAVHNRKLPERYPVPRANLPEASTPFVGREHELDQLSAMLADPGLRLVTLVGSGGAGKTRLAVEAARQQVGQFNDGVFFVPLAGLDAAVLSTALGQLVGALAGILGFQFYGTQDPQEQLAAYLRGKELLLLLDNFEHLLGNAGSVTAPFTVLADWLAWLAEKAPRIRLLVTSRVALSLPGERVFTLGGLGLPDEAGPGDALNLFTVLARRMRPGFALRPEAAAVGRICQLVGGSPLAIELSSAWVRSYSCVQIAQQIESNLDFLTTQMQDVPERHRSLRAVFLRSWTLLSTAEQIALAGLSVFRGGFNARAAAQVAGADAQVLHALVDKSLVQVVDGANERFDLHSLVRQFAAEQLAHQPQLEETVIRKHTAFFGQFMTGYTSWLHDQRQLQALQALAVEEDNTRLSWQRMVEGCQVTGLAACMDGFYRYYSVKSRFSEGIELLSGAVSAIQDSAEPDPLAFGMAAVRLANLQIRIGGGEPAEKMLIQARSALQTVPFTLGDAIEENAFFWSTLSDLHIHHGQYEAAYQDAQEAQRLFQKVGSCSGMGRANFLLGMISYRLGQVEQAREYLQEAVEMARQAGEPRLRLTAIDTLADVLCHFGEYETAQHYFEEALETSRTLGDRYYSALILNNLGTVHFTQQRFAQAGDCYQESLDLCQQVGDRVGEAIALSNLSEIASLEGEHGRAWQLCEQTLAIGRELADTWTILAAFCGLAEAAFAQGDFARSQEYAMQGLRLASSSQTLQMQARLAVNLGGTLWKLGNAETARQLLCAASQDQACADDVRQRAQALLVEMGGANLVYMPLLSTLVIGLLEAERTQ